MSDAAPTKQWFLAIVNPAAGGGRGGKLAPAALQRVRGAGIELDVVETKCTGDATNLARSAYAKGVRSFLAVGGDGTAFEIVNGLFPEGLTQGRVTLGFLPLGTGNSFLRDFTTRGMEHTLQALRNGSRKPCDLILLRHSGGNIYFINLMSLGFPAEVGEVTNRRFKRWGELGYILGVLSKLAWLEYRPIPHRVDSAPDWDRRPCLFLTFSNSKFTGGKMMIAPLANPSDAKIEYVRWAPIGRLRLLCNFPRLFSGTHVHHKLASRAAAERIDLDLAGPVTAVIDGEIVRVQCRSVEIVPNALDIVV